jgi:NAD+ kinase
LTDEVEFIISLGGDGTLLDTITLVRDKDIAIMGINFGRMGFLASIGRDELRVAVKAMVQRTYVVDKRSLIHWNQVCPCLVMYLMRSTIFRYINGMWLL